MLLGQFHLFFAASFYIWMQPLEEIRHLKLFVSHVGPVGHHIGDNSACRLIEVNLSNYQLPVRAQNDANSP